MASSTTSGIANWPLPIHWERLGSKRYTGGVTYRAWYKQEPPGPGEHTPFWGSLFEGVARTRDEAIEQVRLQLRAALGNTRPVLICWAGMTGLAWFEGGTWSYRIQAGADTDVNLTRGCTVGHTSRAEVERRLRTHLASLADVEGDGACLLSNPDDIADFWRHCAGNLGYWVASALGERDREEQMAAFDQAVDTWRDHVRQGMDARASYWATHYYVNQELVLKGLAPVGPARPADVEPLRVGLNPGGPILGSSIRAVVGAARSALSRQSS